MDEELPDLPSMREQAQSILSEVLDDPDARVPIPAVAFLAYGLLCNTLMRCPDCDRLHENAGPVVAMREAFGRLVTPKPIDVDQMKTIRNTLLTMDGGTLEAEQVIQGLTNAAAVFTLIADNPAMGEHIFHDLSPRRFDWDAPARLALKLMLEAMTHVENDWQPIFVQNMERATWLVENQPPAVDHVFNPPIEMLGFTMSMN